MLVCIRHGFLERRRSRANHPLWKSPPRLHRSCLCGTPCPRNYDIPKFLPVGTFLILVTVLCPCGMTEKRDVGFDLGPHNQLLNWTITAIMALSLILGFRPEMFDVCVLHASDRRLALSGLMEKNGAGETENLRVKTTGQRLIG